MIVMQAVADEEALLNTLGPTLLVTFLYVVIFLATRKRQKRFYAPRSYLGSLRDRYVASISLATSPDRRLTAARIARGARSFRMAGSAGTRRYGSFPISTS